MFSPSPASRSNSPIPYHLNFMSPLLLSFKNKNKITKTKIRINKHIINKTKKKRKKQKAPLSKLWNSFYVGKLFLDTGFA